MAVRTVLVCETQVPLVRGGAELLVQQLVSELKARGVATDRVSLPFKWYPKDEILPHAAAWRLLDLSESNGRPIDLVPVDGKLGRAGGAPPGAEGRNLDHFCLRVAPFDERAIREQLARYGYGAGPVERRFGAEGDGPSVYVTDPEGNVVELKGPPGG